jgi:hypothetical protein
MLLYSVLNHPWVGKLLFNHNGFQGIIKEVADCGSKRLYVSVIYNDGEYNYFYVNCDTLLKDDVLTID